MKCSKIVEKRSNLLIEELSERTGVDMKSVRKILDELNYEKVLSHVSDYAPDKVQIENLTVGIRVSAGAVDV